MSTTVAVVGAGLIGQSWAAAFVAHGATVTIWDVRENIAEQISAQLPTLVAEAMQASVEEAAAIVAASVRVVDTVEEAVAGVDAVQESIVEDAAAKAQLWEQVAAAAPQGALLLSSSSAIPASAQHPRVVIGHPFNPPHILPLVEVVAEETTPQETTEAVIAFYREMGKRPVRLLKEKPGFVANRLQAALLAEASQLVDEGVITMAGVDDIVTSSIGIRWAAVGPFLAFHLGGGEGGLGGLLKHIGVGLFEAIDREDVLAGDAAERLGALAEETYPRDTLDAAKHRRDQLQQIIIDAQERQRSQG